MRWHSDEWIQRVSEFLKPVVEKTHKEFYRRANSYASAKAGALRYEKSKKGIEVRKKVSVLRQSRFFKFRVPEQEQEMIWIFYEDCPEGYVVDHIFPLSKVGLHTLSNLQWIPRFTNSRKSNKILPFLSQYAHCRLDIKELI